MKQITRPIQNGITPQSALQTLDPQQKLDQGKKAAKALMTVAKPITINGKSYLRYEDLQTIAAFFQCTAGTSDPEYVQIEGIKGYKANACVRNKDGNIISTASAYCLREGTWTNRENYALASMAQTRAAAKALRNAFGWIVTLSGFEPTPAEEMTFTESKPPETVSQELATDKQVMAINNLVHANPDVNNEERQKLAKLMEKEITKAQAKDVLDYFFGHSRFEDGQWVKIKEGVLDKRKHELPE